MEQNSWWWTLRVNDFITGFQLPETPMKIRDLLKLVCGVLKVKY